MTSTFDNHKKTLRNTITQCKKPSLSYTRLVTNVQSWNLNKQSPLQHGFCGRQYTTATDPVISHK